MSTKELYQRFARLCQRWPKDESKSGRDYSQIFRDQLNEHFPHGELGQVKNPARVTEILEPLEMIANSKYYEENQLKRSSASGLDIVALRDAISNEGIRVIQEQDESSLLARLKNNLSTRFSKSGMDRNPDQLLEDNKNETDSKEKRNSGTK